MRSAVFCLFLLSTAAYSYNYNDGKHLADNAYQKAISKLNNMKSPEELMGSIFKGVPKESGINVNELEQKGNSALSQIELGQILINQARERLKQKSAKASDEVELSNDVIAHADIMTKGGCYKRPSQCKTTTKTEQCIDKVRYQTKKHISSLTVKAVVLSSSNRQYQGWRPAWYRPLKINLSKCDYSENGCNSQKLVKILKDCKNIKVTITSNTTSRASDFRITKYPSCSSPIVEFYTSNQSSGWGASYTINVQQIGTLDTWSNLKGGNNDGSLCYQAGQQQCLEKNLSKIIDGISVFRPCWRQEVNYQCMQRVKGSCDNLIQKGCAQIKSECLLSNNNLCLKYAQSFQCSKTSCSEEKEICYQKVDCADGSCQKDAQKDAANKEKLDGLTNLSALVGSAQNVQGQNLSTGIPNIFSGNREGCRRAWGEHPVNCCTHPDSAFCSQAERRLAQKKLAGLAVRVNNGGDDVYCSKKRRVWPFDPFCVAHSESWCIFDSRLAYLIRVSGGYTQLGKGFGWVSGDTDASNCNGLTPEELSRVQLDKINLSDLEKDVLNQYKAPSSNSSINGNASHIEDLEQKGSAYDY